ncbi:hypothetical protein R0131_00975 [Clostridium sp. AL.422]|uniref:hypothetical protein n=1 Tax=Clostridium TaxID=1485 RepID=UPI00293DF6AC|nr:MULTISPECIES: hypothetical protein [unclassified Clostridium]MDV4149400.1 hypothetical protein [Clostridium sp. AL.422]
MVGIYYATSETIPYWVKQKTFTVSRITYDKALLAEITSWVYLKDLVLAGYKA